jgi:hypothetical protein
MNTSTHRVVISLIAISVTAAIFGALVPALLVWKGLVSYIAIGLLLALWSASMGAAWVGWNIPGSGEDNPDDYME